MKNLSTVKYFLTLLILGFCLTSLHAEKAPIKFGKISQEEMNMMVYEPDTSAAAVVLCDYGVTDMPFDQNEGHFYVSFKKIVRLKILKKEGLEWADFSIRLHKEDDKLVAMKGCTYNLENGKIEKTKLDSDGKFRENTSKYYDTYKVTLPNAKVGSIVELTYTIRSNSFFSLKNWYFQRSIPVRWSEYTVSIPEFYHYKKMAKGFLPFVKNSHDYAVGTLFGSETYSIENFTWAVEKAPAFKSEPFMTTSRNFLSAMEFELAGIQEYKGPYKDYTNTWEKINKQLMDSEYFGQQLKGGGFLKEDVAQIESKAKTPEEKMMAAFHFIKQHMKWNDYYGKYTTNTLRKAYKEKSGNVADINLMLVLLLRELGLEAHPVILSTRDNGIPPLSFPNMGKFNYVIAQVTIGDQKHLLDATDPLCPCDLLPFRCLNDKGRIITEKGTDWVDIKTGAIYKYGAMANLNLSEEGELTGKMSISRNAYAALSFREKMEEKTEEEIQSKLEEEHTGMSIEEMELENLKEPEKAIRTNLEVEISDKVEDAGERVYLNPMLYEQVKKNPFTLQDRKYPVDFGHPYEETYILELTLPEGYVLESKPENMRMALPEKGGLYSYSIQQLNDKIQLISRLKINNTIFVGEGYANLKEFYNQMVAKQAEMLVIKKKS